MGTVMTVLGPVPASELGAVTMHEHLHLDQMEGIWIDRRGGYADTGAQFGSVAAARLGE
jgi:predicted metal-dependent phosphotriesterase family hydrolase